MAMGNIKKKKKSSVKNMRNIDSCHLDSLILHFLSYSDNWGVVMVVVMVVSGEKPKCQQMGWLPFSFMSYQDRRIWEDMGRMETHASWSMRKGVNLEPEDGERNANGKERRVVKTERTVKGRNRRG